MNRWLTLLDRIGATSTEATLDTLHHLQRQAMLALPFENFDIHLGRPIHLDLDAVYGKVIAGQRGGFCYELNECFYHCLAAMGYEVARLEARVELGGPGAPFDHQCTLVVLDGERWMADIGMGDSTLTPLNLDQRGAQTDGRSWFRVAEDDGFLGIFRQYQTGEWSKVLILNPEPQPWERFAERCHWQQTSPDSVFVHKRLCTRATPRERITLTGNTLKEVGEDTSETRIEEPEYETVLAERFGVVLEAPSWRVPLR
jgi:N-hydroxyarylamine O-acetyltransferase